MSRMKFDEIMEAYWQGDEGPFTRWVERRMKLDSFPPFEALSYIRLALENTITHGDYDFPNFRTASNALWSLRWAVKTLVARSLRA